ncbi:MAG: two-component system, OmpR family, sensor histidine kinase KdpD, partial [Solirubrobacteraceae bacterium]|nr:two-component system, OmpR family, sensor histidine kinase KdpD [Solirubrobacteraceae bacterium]
MTLRVQRPPLALGIACAAAGVAGATGAVFALRGSAPVVSLSVVYLVVVLLVSTYWGLVLGVATSIASALAFNFCFLDPTGRFTIADSRNFAALLALVVVAIVVSSVAETARARAAEAEERRREADLSASLARTLLGGPRLDEALAQTAHQLAEVLGAASMAIELGGAGRGLQSEARRVAIPLRDGGQQIGALVLPADVAAAQGGRLSERIVP